MHVMSRGDVRRLQSSLENEGYAVMRKVVSKDRLTDLASSLADEYKRARAGNELFSGGGALSGHLNCFPGEQARFVYDEIVDYRHRGGRARHRSSAVDGSDQR